jgi:hypothetical protein
MIQNLLWASGLRQEHGEEQPPEVPPSQPRELPEGEPPKKKKEPKSHILLQIAFPLPNTIQKVMIVMTKGGMEMRRARR